MSVRRQPSSPRKPRPSRSIKPITPAECQLVLNALASAAGARVNTLGTLDWVTHPSVLKHARLEYQKVGRGGRMPNLHRVIAILQQLAELGYVEIGWTSTNGVQEVRKGKVVLKVRFI